MMKNIEKRGKKFRVNFKPPNQDRVRGTFDTEKEAETWLLQAKANIARGEPLPPFTKAQEAPTSASRVPPKARLKFVLEDTIAIKWRENKTSASAENAEQFVKWAGPDLPAAEAFAIEKIHAYVRFLQGKGRSGKTINKKLSAVNMMMGHAVALKLVPVEVKMPRQKEGKGRLRYFTMDEQRAIMHWTRHLGYDHAADLWQFLVDTGARPNEARLSRWGDYRGGRVTFEAPDTKTDMTRTVPMTAAAVEAIKRRRNDPVLGNMAGPFTWATQSERRKIWDKLREFLPWLNDEDTVPYTFRHTCASRLAMANKSAPLIKNWMGHTTLATTEKYMHLAPSAIDNMHSALENFVDPTFDRATEKVAA